MEASPTIYALTVMQNHSAKLSHSIVSMHTIFQETTLEYILHCKINVSVTLYGPVKPENAWVVPDFIKPLVMSFF